MPTLKATDGAQAPIEQIKRIDLVPDDIIGKCEVIGEGGAFCPIHRVGGEHYKMSDEELANILTRIRSNRETNAPRAQRSAARVPKPTNDDLADNMEDCE